MGTSFSVEAGAASAATLMPGDASGQRAASERDAASLAARPAAVKVRPPPRSTGMTDAR